MSEISEHIMHMRVAQAEISRLKAELEGARMMSARLEDRIFNVEFDLKSQLTEAKQRLASKEDALCATMIMIEEYEKQLSEAREEVERLKSPVIFQPVVIWRC